MFAPLLIFIVCLVPVLLLLIHNKLKQHKKSLYPIQKKLIQELINDLKNNKIDVILSEEGPKDSSVTLTLLEAKDLMDTKKELAKEKYDDLSLYFTNNINQIIDLDKYFKDPILPKEIISELQHFHNTYYTKADPTDLYFVIITNFNAKKKKLENVGDILYTGNAEAFESWLSFKESADNLNYVINQWLKENSTKNEKEMFWEFERTEENEIHISS
ncbi:MAG: hypothetical protein H0U95_04490 [Bacteroidetes bacterium]|nr:hypothetical protein [Bacteroidota bacterium]